MIDTGVGIPEGAEKYIFDKFTQADREGAGPAGGTGGTGLGLAISRQLVELMGGEINISRNRERGLTFEVVFPLRRAGEEIKDTGEDRWFGRRLMNRPPQDMSDFRILTVVDNYINHDVISSYLDATRALTFRAPSAREAITMLRKAAKEGSPFHLVILDYRMAETSGEKFAEEIRADKEISDTLLVMLTVAGRQIDIHRLEELDIAASIPKPFRGAQFMEMVTDMLSLYRAGRSDKSAVERLREIGGGRGEQSLKSSRRVFDARVLLVEDSPTNQIVSSRILQKFGCVVDLAENGKEAVDALLGGSYDLVFMDCQMPVMDGFEATREILKNEKDGHTPIVAMTANAIQGDREKCISAGMDDYISKPIKQYVIEEVLDKYCTRSEKNVCMLLTDVLVAEEDPATSKAIQHAVRSVCPGVRIRTVKGGVDACVSMGSSAPDLLVIGMTTPELECVHVVDFIRRNKRFAKTRVIVIWTAEKNDPRINRLIELGVNDIIFSPLTTEKFILVLEEIFAEGRVRSNHGGGVTSGPETAGAGKAGGTDELPVLDSDQIFRMVGREVGVIKEFVEIFLQDVSVQMRRLEDAVGAGDRAVVEEVAHRIKGASGDVGGMRLYRSVSEIEKAARDNVIALCSVTMPVVSKDFVMLKEALENSSWDGV